MLALFLLMTLPLLEIAGFIVIGDKIGVGLSLLWVVIAVFLGFYLLASMGSDTLQKAKKSVAADIYPFEEMFDGFCVIVGALFLIFPGFISDFLAIPLLIPPIRRGIFKFLRSQHKSFLNSLGKKTQGVAYWYYEDRKNTASPTIEAEFKKLEEDNPPPKI